MKIRLGIATLLLACAVAGSAHVDTAQADPLVVGPDDTIVKLLTAQTGKVVTLQIGCDEELTGKVKAVSANVVHLSELSGKEFYDAAVATGSIRAVLVRTH